jgi:hypothetical protein
VDAAPVRLRLPPVKKMWRAAVAAALCGDGAVGFIGSHPCDCHADGHSLTGVHRFTGHSPRPVNEYHLTPLRIANTTRSANSTCRPASQLSRRVRNRGNFPRIAPLLRVETVALHDEV